jgi:integrase/recombinase XerC
MNVTPLTSYPEENSTYNISSFLANFEMSMREVEKSDNTVINYLCDLKAFASWFIEERGEFMSPSSVTSIDLREYKEFLLSEGKKPQTTNRKLASIKAFLKWAVEKEIIDAIPRFPKLVKQADRPIRWLDRKQQNALLRMAEREGDRNLGVVQLLLNTGLRASELCDLLWSDVSMSDRKGLLVVRSGKGSKRREVPLNKEARDALQLLGWKQQRETTNHVLQGQRGKMTPRGLGNLLNKYSTKISELSPHSLRHTFCKNLIDAGVSLEKVAALAGHENLETTRRYCLPSAHDLQKAVDAMSLWEN